MSTYLELVNVALRRLNEVELTSVTFSSAVGFHAHMKDAVNDSLRDIYLKENEWPFARTAGTQTLTPGTQLYDLPAAYSTVDWESFFLRPRELVTNTDFTSNITSWTDISTGTGSAAYTATGNGRMRLAAGASGVAAATQLINVYIGREYRIRTRIFGGTITVNVGTTSGGSDVTTEALTVSHETLGTWHEVKFTPTTTTVYISFTHSTNDNYDVDYVSVTRDVAAVKLEYLDFDYWARAYKTRDFGMNPEEYGVPKFIFRTQNDEFGISPHADEDYEVTYDYWATFTDLSAYTDTSPLPERYENVFIDKMLFYGYAFRSNVESMQLYKEQYDEKIKQMRRQLIRRPNNVQAVGNLPIGNSNRSSRYI